MDAGTKLSKLQTAELAILKEFLKICEKNNLKYYLIGGSFLGAVRHKGFIPWDDDIDVAMPRPDYEEFLKIAPALLPENLYLSTYKLGKEHYILGAVIYNKKKEFLLNNAAKQMATGAWVDISMLDGAPDPGMKRRLFGIRYMYRRMMFQFAHFDEVVNLNADRPWYERAAIRFAQNTNIENRLDPVKAGDKFDKLLRSNSYEDAAYIANFVGRVKMNEILPREVYGEGTDYEYEGMLVKGPDQADAYLTHFYGDYMTPPPPEERNRHNVTDNEGER